MPFPTDFRGIPPVPAPDPLRARVHPLVGFPSATEFLFDCHPPNGRSRSNAFLGVSFSLATPARGVHVAGRAPRSCLSSAHGVSHTHDGFLLFVPCGLVSSHCHFRDSHFRGFPRYQADPCLHGPCPHVVWRRSSTFEQALRRRVMTLRLQGVSPGSDP